MLVVPGIGELRTSQEDAVRRDRARDVWNWTPGTRDLLWGLQKGASPGQADRPLVRAAAHAPAALR